MQMQCVPRPPSLVSGGAGLDHERLYIVKISISKSSMPWWQQSLNLTKVIQAKANNTVEKYKIFTLPNVATPTGQ